MSNGKPLEELETQEPSVGVQGFKCPLSGKEVSIAQDCTACKNRCMSIPVLASLPIWKPRTASRFGVTEILDPPQVTYLRRNKPYWIEPTSMIWAQFGSAFHQVIEDGHKELVKMGLGEDYLFEQKFEADIETQHGIGTLSGRIDLVVPSKGELWDFKTTKEYFIRSIRKGWDDTNYHWQLNMYRVYAYPSCDKLFLECIVKDWSERGQRNYSIDPIMTIKAPNIPDEDVRARVTKKMGELLLNQEDPETVRPCTREETWGRRKCRNYCGVRDICPQYKRETEELEHELKLTS